MNSLKDKLIPKLKATLTHLGLSLLVFMVILYFILFEWYPEPFFTAQGGWQGIRLMAFVDLVLGPCLTLIVFNHLKSRRAILFDLSLVVLIQIGALIWGGYQVYTQRPIALVFWADAFYTVTSYDYSEQGIDNPEFTQYSSYVPPLIYSRSPSDLVELEVSRQLTKKSIPIYAQVSLYEKVEDNLKTVFLGQVNIKEVIATNVEMKTLLMKITHDDIDAYNYVSLKAKFQNMILVMTADGELVGEVKAPYHK